METKLKKGVKVSPFASISMQAYHPEHFHHHKEETIPSLPAANDGNSDSAAALEAEILARQHMESELLAVQEKTGVQEDQVCISFVLAIVTMVI